MMDAVPVTLGQEFGAWARQVELGIARLRGVMPRLLRCRRAAPRSAPGSTGIRISTACSASGSPTLTGLPFTPNPNKFEGMGAHDALVELSGVMNVIAVSLTKLGNDIRLLGCGPRSGHRRTDRAGGWAVQLDHARQDQSDPVRGADHGLRTGDGESRTVTIAGAQGHLELNVFKPVIIQNVLQSCRCWPIPRTASRSTWWRAGAEP